MKPKKTVTRAVLAANRTNARSSTGPRTERGKSNIRNNAFQHGILARKVALETDEEKVEFQKLFQSCDADFKPQGLPEKFLVEEIATLFWRLQIALGLETQELAIRQDVGDKVDRVFQGDLDLPISASQLPINKGWDCERIVVRAIAGKGSRNTSASRGPAIYQNQIVNAIQNSQNNNRQEAGHLEVEAVLGSSLEKMTRYQAALKRDLYRAIEMLRKVQAERREREGSGS